jgi:hypothetical protein
MADSSLKYARVSSSRSKSPGPILADNAAGGFSQRSANRAVELQAIKAAITILALILCIPLSAAYSEGAPLDELILDLKDDDPSIREAAVASLGRTGDAAAIEPLISALSDNDWYVRKGAAMALGGIGEPAIGPLKALLRDESPTLRVLAVLALSETGNGLTNGVLDSLAREDGVDLAGAARDYARLIRKGEHGTEWTLILALFRHGGKEMAEDFINCGNHLLSTAAQRWTQRRGLQIIPYSGASNGPLWGSR